GDAEDRCPITPPEVQRLHWGMEDPAKAEGTEKRKKEVFRRVRNEIESRIREFAKIKKTWLAPRLWRKLA
ncbi:MAG TPA: hypothetical protein VF199_12570, partial [Bacillales bacterium]